ncbi:hypothetical protein DFR58_10945 [Anaerobacterium chartisolvens]|uniref:Pyridoxal phosphate homeostasis protein n=1 Tax=Anaerobacterium chartisolvens TaxID=1297424 RepID=A0A369B5M1_9FIRM|nr:YggS family pyridoxal phosphate-dependent enzyme [Anaerobacterium chartisolvens]RCX16819.1 hypothetical protein DFR58_10945 [Anaerobacterium chartisolvens]
MMGDSDIIRNNISDIIKRVGAAAEKSGRTAGEIHIIAVSKTIEPERIVTAVDCGMTELGENRVQELCEKYDKIDRECHWHLIGHLQTNKVKYIIDRVKLIHSVDRAELAEEIQQRAKKIDRPADILIQVNVSGEGSKYGISPDGVMDFVKAIASHSHLRVKGLMTMAPFTDNPEEVRYVFRDLNKIFIDIKKENIDNIDMRYISMGMSNDFEVAIEEGANMVRIGTAIFGRRA